MINVNNTKLDISFCSKDERQIIYKKYRRETGRDLYFDLKAEDEAGMVFTTHGEAKVLSYHESAFNDAKLRKIKYTITEKSTPIESVSDMSVGDEISTINGSSYFLKYISCDVVVLEKLDSIKGEETASSSKGLIGSKKVVRECFFIEEIDELKAKEAFEYFKIISPESLGSIEWDKFSDLQKNEWNSIVSDSQLYESILSHAQNK